MTRAELVKKLADYVTKPLTPQLPAEDFAGGMRQPVGTERSAEAAATRAPEGSADLFVWFEDTAVRQDSGRRGIAGLPECLLPWHHKMRVVERRYAEGHLHLLSAVRLRCAERQGERIAAIYTAALSVGTVAWIGTGRQYELAWHEMFPYSADRLTGHEDSASDESCGA